MQPAPVSERRLAANRANALKSTGPRTPEGKRKSSQNACQHRLYARKFRMSPEAEAANHARALRDSAHIEDPALRELYYRLILATGHCELNWSYRDGLEAYANTLYPGDSQMAMWWVLHQDGLLLALHRHESFYNHQILGILQTIEKMQRPARKSQPRTQNSKQRTQAAPHSQPQTQPESQPNPVDDHPQTMAAPAKHQFSNEQTQAGPPAQPQAQPESQPNLANGHPQTMAAAPNHQFSKERTQAAPRCRILEITTGRASARWTPLRRPPPGQLLAA
jgi:hypothetical protein